MASRFLESYTASSARKLDQIELLTDLAVSYPEVAAALRGQEGDGNGHPHVPAMKLSFQIREGAFKWSLYSPDSAFMFFGTVRNVKEPLASVESDLASETYDKVLTKDQSASNRKR